MSGTPATAGGLTPMSSPSSTAAHLLRCCAALAAFGLGLARAAEAPTKSFDVPAGEARTTLKQFTTQAGEQLLYSMDTLRGVSTRAVKGRMNARDALNLMFVGTPVTVVQDRENGALSLVRAPDPNVPRAVAAAKSRPRPQREDEPAAGEPLALSPFTVRADRDEGYIARDSLAGSRLNTPLKDTAASLTVLTRDFLEDVGATTVAEAMQWSTNSQLQMQDTLTLANNGDDINATFFNFDAFRVRGLPATLTKNYFPWELPSDTYNLDRVEEARGPNSILFGIGAAGGVVNSMTKHALFGRDLRSATLGLSAHSGHRATLDVNRGGGQRLAVRLNAVHDRTGSFRNFNFAEKQFLDLATTFKASRTTTLRAEYETGRLRDNIGTNQQATDVYGFWVAAGRPLIGAPIDPSQHTAYGVNRFGVVPRVTYVGNTGTVMNLANQYASFGDDFVFDPRVVPYRVSVGGPGVLRRPHFDTVTLALEQQFGRSTFLELAYNHQQFLTFNQQVNSGVRVFIDPNATLPTGQPNPFAGRHYLESESWAWDYGQRADTTRLSLAHELDAGRWGKYRFAAMGEYDWRSLQSRQLFEVWGGHPFHPNPENQANVVVRRQYVTPGDWDNFHYPNPIASGLIRGLTDPVTGQTLHSTWIPRNDRNVRDNPEHQQSLLLATQARYFQDRLVVSVGFRGDKLRTITRGATRDANALFVPDYASNTFATYEGRTKTLGAVFHLTPHVSFFYNSSDNFGLPPNITLVPDGRRAPNPEGRGTDCGVSVSLFDGRLYARANYYKTDLVNGANSNYGGSITAPNAVGDSILNALVQQGLITAAEADRHRVTNSGATYAQVVEGYEFNLTANPTTNWRLQANYSYTDGFTSEVAPEVQVWAARELPYFRRFDQGIATNIGTIGQALATWEDYHDSQLDLVGVALAGNRKYKVTLFTAYEFDDGPLRGVRVGGGYRHYSKMPIGQYPDRSIQYGPSFWDSLAMLGYRFAHVRHPWLRRVSLQLNVSNVFNEDDAYVFRRDQTAPEKIRRLRVREPRSWRLAAAFDF